MSRHVATGNAPGPSEAAQITDPEESARTIGLRYMTDRRPGIGRKRAGKGFSYYDSSGKHIVDPEEIARFKALAIPPAWTDVWIAPSARAHIQATGRDAKSRKQYRYHPQWREARNETKYSRMITFGHALPKIRERVDEDLSLPGLPRRKVVATAVRLLEVTHIRVGNEEYARENRSFGLTTLRCRHVKVRGATMRFRFNGKGGRQHIISLTDRRLARVLKRCQELPGQELFVYLDDEGKRESVDSEDVNDYLREATGEDFTAKEFRTWAGTLLAAEALSRTGPSNSAAEAKRNIARAIEETAGELGNTPAICRSSYVHPDVIEAYVDGLLFEYARPRRAEEYEAPGQGLSRLERAVLRLLEAKLKEEAGDRREEAH